MKIEDIELANKLLLKRVKVLEDAQGRIYAGNIFLKQFKPPENVIQAGIEAMNAEIQLEIDQLRLKISNL